MKEFIIGLLLGGIVGFWMGCHKDQIEERTSPVWTYKQPKGMIPDSWPIERKP